MKTHTVTRYLFSELSKEAQQSAIENYCEQYAGEIFSFDELIDSLESFASALNITIRSYSLSAWSHSYVQWDYQPDNCGLENLSGLRLRTWLVNNWLPVFEHGKYRLTRIETDERSAFAKLPFVRRATILAGGPNAGKYLCSYRSRIFKEIDCPLTGVCFDMELMGPILDFIRSPDERDLRELIHDCFDRFVRAYQDEEEAAYSKEAIRENLKIMDWDYLSDGRMY